ncbi:MAG TPA: MFS transporter [Pirellulales bacterium]
METASVQGMTSGNPPPAMDQASARNARLSLGLLLAINLFNYIDRYVLSAALPKIQEDLMPSGAHADERAGDLASAFLIAYMFASPVFGWLADRTSRWLLVGGAVVVWSLASGGSGLALSFAAMLVTRILVGVGEAAYGPTAPALISDLYPIERRGRVLAWFYMAIPVGSAIGYAFGGQMAQHGLWREAFYLVVPPGLILALLCFKMRDPRRGAAEAQPVAARSARLHDYIVLARTPSYVFNTIGMTALTFAIGGVAFWMPKYIQFRGEPDLGQIGFKFGALTALSGLTATLLGGIVGDKLAARYKGAYFLVSGTSLLLAFPCFLLVLHRPFPEAWAWIFLTEFCLFFNTGPANTILANVTHPAMRATGFALNILIIHLFGDALSPKLIGRINDSHHGDMNVGFRAVSIAIVVGGIFWLIGARYLGRDTQLAPTRIDE